MYTLLFVCTLTHNIHTCIHEIGLHVVFLIAVVSMSVYVQLANMEKSQSDKPAVLQQCCFELVSSHQQGIRVICLAHHLALYMYMYMCMYSTGIYII